MMPDEQIVSEIDRLRAENASLLAAVNRVRALNAKWRANAASEFAITTRVLARGIADEYDAALREHAEGKPTTPATDPQTEGDDRE